VGVGRSELRNGIPSPGAVPGSARQEPPTTAGLSGSACSRAGYNPAAAALGSYTDVDSPARGLTFSAMTPNAVKRRRFRTKCDEIEIFLRASETSWAAPHLWEPLRRTLLSPFAAIGPRKPGVLACRLFRRLRPDRQLQERPCPVSLICCPDYPSRHEPSVR
jgi:hypothetical protein